MLELGYTQYVAQGEIESTSLPFDILLHTASSEAQWLSMLLFGDHELTCEG